MRSNGPIKHFLLAFIIALVLYVFSYTFIEHRRTRNGPWQVTFTQSAGGPPTLVINQPALNLSDVRITFPNESSTPTNELLVFKVPKSVPFDVPFGHCIFEDTTFQPGTIVFNLYRHEVQLIPRVLSIDRKEYPWSSGAIFTITSAGSIPVPTNSPPKAP